MPHRPLRPMTALLAALGVAAMAVGGLWWWQSRFEAGLSDGTIPTEVAVETLRRVRQWLAGGLAVGLAALGLVSGWMAWRTWRDGRWPPGHRDATPVEPSRRPMIAAALGIGALAALAGAAGIGFSA